MALEVVKELIIDQLGVAAKYIKMDTDIVNDLDADSLDAVEIIMALEDRFDFNINDEDAEKFRTVSDLVNYIETRV